MSPRYAELHLKLPWIDVISKYHQVIFPSLIFDEVKGLLNIAYNNARPHGVKTHNKVWKFLRSNTKINKVLSYSDYQIALIQTQEYHPES